jgi:hypothetical protein
MIVHYNSLLFGMAIGVCICIILNTVEYNNSSRILLRLRGIHIRESGVSNDGKIIENQTITIT